MRVFTGKNLRRLEVPAPLTVFRKWGENYGSYQQQFMFYTTAIYFQGWVDGGRYLRLTCGYTSDAHLT